ncbi:MAG: SDR family oxidoreductase [Candidatus Margulisbacteria bacterium]|nr:SDR family oxidoreductase [Candidatus Margulisiibacteriota bacterium]
MKVKDKVVIITGASEGIGATLARLLSANQAKVVLAARRAEILKKMESELPNSLAIPTDIRKPEDIVNLINRTVEHFGRVDLLVNGAGQAQYGPIEKVDIAEYQSIVELNVYGPLRAMQAVIPQMRKQGGGMILNISSMVSKQYIPLLGSYASTKYALNALSLTARQELAPDKIIVSVFHPRMTATNFGKNALGVRMFENLASAGSYDDMPVDSTEIVAAKILMQIESEEAESMMI